MKLAFISLSIIACFGLNSVSATEAQLPTSNDHWIDVDSVALEPESVPVESEAENQTRCANENKKAQRKALWASFWLGFASGLGNSTLARREADVKFTDRNGHTSRGTITYTDPYRYAYLRDRDRQYNLLTSSQVAANHMQKAGCR